VLCFGVPLATALAVPALALNEARTRERLTLGFVAGWVPLTAALLTLWPEWSFWYAPAIVAHPDWALPVGLGLEIGAFACGLAVARRLDRQGLTLFAGATGLLYGALLIVPWSRYGHVGTPLEVASGAAPPLWGSVPLLAVLAVGGAWLLVQWAGAVRDSLPLVLVAVLALGAGGCAEEPVPVEVAPVVVPVSVAVDVDVAAVAGRWRRAGLEAGGVPMEMRETDAALGLTSLIGGHVEAAIVLRRATPAEERFAAGDDLVPRLPLHYELIARVPVIFLVHETNSVDLITRDDLRRVLGGEIREWDSLGGRAEVIAVYGRPPGTATAAQIEPLLEGSPAGAVQSLPDDAGVATAVRADPLGLGVGGGAPVRGTKVLAVRDGDDLLMPGVGTPAGRPWPWVRNVYIVTQGPPSARVLAVRDLARSEAGVRIAEQAGFFGWVEGWQ